ncbi:alpha/beta fold hydrolase [Porphyrobacter sp. GA68]|uniref:alpha/beta fold hydrolase n=1 Tax=Porphyrobacter sp. GA68 TaxID=2883480 RepID=UPI001D18658F|nr:alpha/beta fold hydrolase [Porphyrobacter sp. GA68]
MSEQTYADRHWTSADGLRLHFRDYPAAVAAGERAPVICLHGLTRNARDFADLAEFLAPTGRRILVPEMRGRGDSEYARDAATYNVGQYVADLNALREQEGIDRYVAIGTSMGGLMTMVQAMHDPAPIAAAVLNDIGPVVDPAGLERIMDYVGQGGSYPTWIHAARALEELHKAAYPGFDLDDWLQMAKRTMTLCGNGRIAHDYDMSIAEPLRAADGDQAAAPADLWPGFDALAQRPLMLIRGELSNLLSQATFAEMRARAPQAAVVSVPEIGHAPTLDEPCVRSALGEFMARLD